VRLFAVIALAAGAIVLSAASSPAGATWGVSHQLRGFVPHTAHASRLPAASRTHQTAGFNCVSSCAAYESKINQFFTDVAADNGLTTNVYSVASQYAPIEYNETFEGSYVEGRPFPASTCHDGFDKYCLTDPQLQTEIGKVIARNGWPTQAESKTALYFIFTPASTGICQGPGGPSLANNPCTTNVFCAYHSAAADSSFLYAVEPDDKAVEGGGCSLGQAPVGSGADDTLSTVSHEQNEAITDPFPPTGWVSEDTETFDGIPNAFFGTEIGDLCAYNFGASLGGAPHAQYNQIINGHNYFLQQEWSNADGGCVQHLGGTPTNFPSSSPFYGGVGPLVNEGGSVMTTNQIYAIYWVPAKPAMKQLPKITGAPKVGNKLKTSHGTWSNAPKLTYRWLRCSSAGKSCKGITKATGATYTLAKADARHRIEVRVTATNAAGHVSATAAPTVAVKS
jgi:hypothetical protein